MEQTRLGKLIKDAREAHGHTRTTLGQRVGLPSPTIEQWEMGRMSPKGPGAVGLFKIRRALGIDPLELEAAILDLPAGVGANDTPTQAAVRRARMMLGVTVADIAELLDASPDDVDAWEAGVAEATPAVMAALVGLMADELSRRRGDAA